MMDASGFRAVFFCLIKEVSRSSSLCENKFNIIFNVAYVLMAPSLLSGCCQEIPSTFLKIDGGCAIPGDCSLFLEISSDTQAYDFVSREVAIWSSGTHYL